MKNYLLLFTVLTCLGCTPANQLNRFYFGMNKPAGGAVSDREFNQFLQQEISSRFPKGLTLFEAKGQWQGANGMIEQENSRVVEIVCDDKQENRDKVAAIAAKYKALFAQEAVMVIKSQPEVVFH
ncbi:DUF3574 domain-containing protein [Methylobacter sp.]|uniref:DUF3574 domain-containing protein n=1 Tax=Methylobacter sp. TaxID=2051955 RepID=UPI002FDE7513